MKMKVLILIVLLAIMMAGVLTSCTYEELKPVKVNLPDSAKFTLNVIPIFNTSCNNSGCHNKGGIPPDLSPENAYTSLTFFGYVDVDLPEQSNIYSKISIGSMKSYATDQQRAVILKWIKQGALNN